jgi:hypothetical protein
MDRTMAPKPSQDPNMTAAEAEHVALYATEDQIARLVLGKGKDIGPRALWAGPDDELRDLQ